MTHDNQRVRAVLLAAHGQILLLKRLRPGVPEPYWVTVGGGIEAGDESCEAALHREVVEEIGGSIVILRRVLVLDEIIGGDAITQHYYLCRLLAYDFNQRSGPELSDPTRGAHILESYPLDRHVLAALNIKRPAFRTWLLANLDMLRDEVAGFVP